MDTNARRDLQVLDLIAQSERLSQRRLAAHLGVALGLVNLYLKRLVRKGFVKCVNLQSNRVRYLITPKGIAEKTRLTYEFMEYSLLVFRQGRNHLKTILRPYALGRARKIAIYGTGEAAELACLCLKELGLEPTVIFDQAGGGRFLGVPVIPIHDHWSVDYDHIIIATLERSTELWKELLACGVPEIKLCSLRSLEGGPSSETP